MKPKYEKKYNEGRPSRRRSAMNMFYLVITLIVFESIAMALLVFPRSTVSELEKRELAKFPEFTPESYFSGEFTEGISTWFSDTVPFRDDLMEMSAALREMNGLRKDEIKIHGVGNLIVPEEKPVTTAPVQTQKPAVKIHNS